MIESFEPKYFFGANFGSQSIKKEIFNFTLEFVNENTSFEKELTIVLDELINYCIENVFIGNIPTENNKIKTSLKLSFLD